MPRLPIPGEDDGTWGGILNTFLAVSHDESGLLQSNTVGASQLQDNSVVASKIAPGAISKSSLGLSQVDNTADANKPISSATQSALDAKVDSSDRAAANGVATLDSNSKVPLSQIPASPITKILPYSYLGSLSVSTGTFRLYNDSGAPWLITGVRATVAAVPEGSAIIIDVNKNDSTIFTSQANRPTIPSGSTSSGKVTSMDVTTVADGDYLSVDIDQIGSTDSGADLVVQVSVA